MIKNRRLITSALPYVNNLPHLGNVVGSLLSADVFCRFSKMRGYECLFICGTDEYGTASEVSADKEGIHPKELCTRNSAKHKEVYDWFKIECDNFGRTSCNTHTKITQKLFLEMHHNQCFIEKAELRFFCSHCNMFLADRYVSGTCLLCKSDQARGDQCDGCGSILSVSEIANPKCSTCSSVPTAKETTHLFYDLERFQDRLDQCIDKNAIAWTPAAKQVALEWRSKKLIPRCITRDLKYNWGVPVPLPGYDNKVLYVWFDAPIGYISFTDEIGKLSWWSDNDVDLYEFMGKDNVFFHSVFFPALLMGCTSIFKYPKMISSTHYLMYEEGKFSKSQNRGIFGHNLLGDALGPEGVWRFHLMRARPETNDTDFSWLDFYESLNAMLINTIGNFCYRVLSYIDKRMGGVLTKTELPESVKDSLNEVLSEYIYRMENTEIRQAVLCTVEIASIGNAYIQLAFSEKVPPEVMAARMSSAVNIILLLAKTLYPFTPTESMQLLGMLSIHEVPALADTFEEELQAGYVLQKPSILFHPLSDDQISKVEQLCTKKCPFIKKVQK